MVRLAEQIDRVLNQGQDRYRRHFELWMATVVPGKQKQIAYQALAHSIAGPVNDLQRLFGLAAPLPAMKQKGHAALDRPERCSKFVARVSRKPFSCFMARD